MGGALCGACCCCCDGNTPRPAPRAIPGPAAVLLGAVTPFPDGGGGPSTAILTTFSPRIKTKPRLLFSVRSSRIALRSDVLFLIIRNSSASDSTKFKCLSNARNVPTILRPSCRVTRRRCSTYRNNLLPFPVG